MKINVIKTLKIFTSHEILYSVEWMKKGKGGGDGNGVSLRLIRNVCKNFGREYWRKKQLLGKPSSILVKNI